MCMKETEGTSKVKVCQKQREWQQGTECQYGSKTFLKTERGKPLIPAESCIHQKKKATYHFIKQKPINYNVGKYKCGKPEAERRKAPGL